MHVGCVAALERHCQSLVTTLTLGCCADERLVTSGGESRPQETFSHMQGVAKTRNVGAVDLAPREFENVLSAKYIYRSTCTG